MGTGFQFVCENTKICSGWVTCWCIGLASNLQPLFYPGWTTLLSQQAVRDGFSSTFSLPSLAARVLDFGLSDKDITLPLHSFNFCLFACFLQVWELNPGSHTRSATFHHWPSCFFCSFAVPRWQLILHSSPVNLLFRPSLLNYHSRLAVLRSHVYFR